MLAIHFKDKIFHMLLENSEIKKEDLKKYETLQTEYKKLFAKYEQIKNENPQSSQLDQTVKQLDSKNKEIQEIMAKMY